MKKTYNPGQLISALLMMLALLWLTVSIPFVYNSQQELAKQHQLNTAPANVTLAEEECGNSFGNTTEEKKSSGNSLTEEYLHHLHIDDLFISQISQSHNSENAGVYNAFHGEVHVPPPNIA